MNRQLPWHVIIKQERLKRGWSQNELAREINSTGKTISRWEKGQTQLPGPYLRRRIAQAFETSVEALGLYVEEQDQHNENVLANVQTLSLSIYWGEAPTIEHFLGRERELNILRSLIKDQKCRVISILGLGGVGKTTLGRMLAEQLHTSFVSVYWHSLQQRPTLEQFLEDYLKFHFQTNLTSLPKEKEKQLALLLTSLREQPGLLILDNFEAILSTTSVSTKRYRPGYEDYGRLLQLLGETDHASCLLITSREIPGEIVRLESTYTTTRSLHLGGLEPAALDKLFQILKISGEATAQNNLAHLYSGNPLALKLVAGPIRDLFGGDITSFLQEKEIVFGEITTLLEEQFEPLGEPERELMYWLAIECEAVSLQELRQKIVLSDFRSRFLDRVEFLRRRSLIELYKDGRLTLQPVVMEYVSSKFIQSIVAEIIEGKINLFERHALMQAEAKDYLRLKQEQSILKSIAESLVAHLGREEVVKTLQRLLSSRRRTQAEPSGYAAGNILNLLIHLQVDLQAADFSWQTIRQAYLQGIPLRGASLAHTTLITSVFTDTFSCILSIALSLNGKLLAIGTTIGEVRVWQAETLTPLFTCTGHADGVRSVAFSPDDCLLVSGSEDYTLRIWNTSTGECLRVLQGHRSPVYSVAFSPDGWRIASSSEDATVRIWDASTGASLALLQGHTGRVRSLAFCIDGNTLASGGEDTLIILWNMKTGKRIATLEGHQDIVRALAYSPQTNILASAGNDMVIRLWDTNTLQCIDTLHGHRNLIRALAFSSDGQLLASSSDDQTIIFWDRASGVLLKTLRPQSNRIWSLAFFPGNTILVSANESADEDDLLCYWDIHSGQCIRKRKSYCSLLKSVAFSPDGQSVVSGSEENELRVWEVESGRNIQTLQAHTNRVRAVAFSLNGHMVASGSEDETIHIWDTQSWLCRLTLQGHTHLVRSVAFSPDSSTLVSGSHDQTIRLWETKTGRCLKTIQTSGGLIWSVAFSPDGCLLASGHDDPRVHLWDIASGKLLKVLEGHASRVWSIAFHPQNQVLVSASDDATLRVWDLASGNCRLLLTGHELWVRSVACSPDGKWLASGSHDHTVRIWDISSGQCLSILQGHKHCVWSVAFSPDSQTLASCGDDGTIRLWSVPSGTCLQVYHEDRPYENMDISHAKGLTSAQQSALLTLGAVTETL